MAVTDQGSPATSKRQQILRAASQLFASAGYRDTTLAAVAERVGVTDAGVLHHFKNKEALLLGVVEDYGRTVEEGIQEAGVRGIELLRLVRHWGAGMEATPEISTLLIRLTTEHLTEDGPARRALQAAYRRLLDRYIAAFATAAARGDLRSDLDPVHEASALVAHLDGIRLQWFLSDGELSMAESVQRYVDDTFDRLAP